VDDVMRDAGVIGILKLQLFEDIGGLELPGRGFVGGIGRLVECKRIEDRRLGIVRVCRQNISDDLRLSLREYLAHRV
jgi:hypothetical protein